MASIGLAIVTAARRYMTLGLGILQGHDLHVKLVVMLVVAHSTDHEPDRQFL
jgi:hypothetical protein